METSNLPLPVETRTGSDWLPADRMPHYVDFLQQYVQNLNFMRYLDDAQVVAVDLDCTSLQGVSVL